jgi:phosphate transport system substrate-binding protein
MFKNFMKVSVVAIFISLLCASGMAAKGKEVSMTGSTTVLPIAQACAEYYMQSIDKDAKIIVSGGGSGVGIAAIIDSKTDIGDSSRKIKKEEIESAKKKGVEPFETIIALDGIAVVVNKNVAVANITMEQFKKILTGEVKNWKELGGKDGDIVIVSRDSSSGTYSTISDMVLTGAKLKADAMMVASNEAMATTVAQTPNSIGYVGVGFIKAGDFKVVSVNGIEASEKTVKNNTYPISRTLQMYTNGKPKADVKKFIDFILSKKGQELVVDSGYVKL